MKKIQRNEFEKRKEKIQFITNIDFGVELVK